MTFLIQQTLLYAIPLMIVALAGVFAERSGIINLALEGIMIFGAFMGVYYGRAKRYDNDGDLVNAKRCRTMAILMPALLHGAYDFIATMEDPNCEWVFLVFVLALFAVSLKLVRVGSRSDRYIDGGEGPLFF